MSLDGLRAWVAEVERKLAKRTRVLLVLVAIAIGISGASVFLAIEARSDSVSESDVRALQEKLEERIDELEGGPTAGVGLAPQAGAGEEPETGGGSSADGEEPEGGDSDSDGASDGGNNLQNLLEEAGAAGS